MAIEISEQREGRVLIVNVSGKLTKGDYDRFVPEFERLVGVHGRIRVLFDMRDFHGWSAGALWEDIKFDFKHHKHIERLAIIGETKWQKGMANVCGPFTSAEIRYFSHSQYDDALNWLGQDLAAAA
jgi:hypothetical protein